MSLKRQGEREGGKGRFQNTGQRMWTRRSQAIVPNVWISGRVRSGRADHSVRGVPWSHNPHSHTLQTGVPWGGGSLPRREPCLRTALVSWVPEYVEARVPESRRALNLASDPDVAPMRELVLPPCVRAPDPHQQRGHGEKG